MLSSDYYLIIGAKINGHGFLSLNESRLEHFGVSFGFQIPCVHIIEELVCYIQQSSAGTDQCEQVCQNTVGSYTCACNNGFIIDMDGRSCDGQ